MKDQKLKKDDGKPPFELLPTKPLRAVAEVLAFGAKKYSPHGWREGMDYSRLLGAAMRHLTSFNDGEDLDPETNLSHLAHASCCLLFLIEYIETNTGTDDRFNI